MNIAKILAELKNERDRINQAIALLAKIKSIKLAGWKDVVGDAVTFEFLRKSDKEWTAKDKADYVVDSEKFGKFAAAFEVVRAERFLKGGPTPDMKLAM